MEKDIYTCKTSHSAVHPKLTQHCKSYTYQYEIKIYFKKEEKKKRNEDPLKEASASDGAEPEDIELPAHLHNW